MNTPNKLTMLRIILIPFFVVFLLGNFSTWSKWMALAIFVIASLTDMLDGYLARRDNLVTNFGKFMDAYLSAANIDIVLLCINPSVDIDFLKLEVAYLYKHGVEKVIFVLSHNDINATTMDYKDGLQTCYVDEKKYNLALEYLKENMEQMIF